MSNAAPSCLFPRYTLRTLLVLVTLAAVLFGYESYVSRREQWAAQAIKELHGFVEYDNIAPGWLRRLAGHDYGKRVKCALVHSATVDDAIPHLEQFRSLTRVEVLSDLAGDRDFDKVRFERQLRGVNYYIVPNIAQHVSTPEHMAAVYRYPHADWVWSIVAKSQGKCRTIVFSADAQAAQLCMTDYQRKVIDSKLCSLDRLPKGRFDTEPAVADLNGDGNLDVGIEIDFFRNASAPDGTVEKFPNDDRLWLAAYEITPTGFEPLVEEPLERSGLRATNR